MNAVENRKEFRQERRQLPATDTAFLSGLLQMLAAVYCRAQYLEEQMPQKPELTCTEQAISRISCTERS